MDTNRTLKIDWVSYEGGGEMSWGITGAVSRVLEALDAVGCGEYAPAEALRYDEDTKTLHVRQIKKSEIKHV